jgi:hypothetical protein
VVNDLSDCFGGEVQAKQGAGLSGSKALAAGTTIKQIPAFVFAILAAKGNVPLTAQTVILAKFVGTETLFKFTHCLPPVQK